MLSRALASLNAAVPSRCSVCARWPAQPVCDACMQRFATHDARCVHCALPVPAGVIACGACTRAQPALDACFAAVSYQYPWPALITQFKFQGQAGWAAHFAQMLREVDGVEDTVATSDFVIPMPLAHERLAQRGFNQALELARRIAPPAKLQAHLLLRLRDTPPQASLGRKDRLANVRRAFSVDPLRSGQLQGRSVLLVDDVMTSGASLFSAAKALRDAGASHVAAAVLARTDEPGE